MRQLRLLLLPLSCMYSAVLHLRHFLYDTGIFKSYRNFKAPVICIGNLDLGGTGKTPMTEFLVSRLLSHYRIGMVSRGYGRRTNGYIEVSSSSTAEEVGDEPLQIYRKFAPQLKMAVCADRKTGIEMLLQRNPELSLIILDDAFQHRKVQADLNILLTENSKPFDTDLLIPAGGLRDVKSASRRADIIVRTKALQYPDTPTLSGLQQRRTPIFYSGISYQGLKDTDGNAHTLDKDTPVVLVSGIARSRPLEEHVKNSYCLRRHLNYPDHYQYTAETIRQVHEIFDNFAAPGGRIITTEKDITKISPFIAGRYRELWLIQPIGVEIAGGEQGFLECIRKKLKS